MARYWLFKSEPDVYGIHHLQAEPGQRVRWDGIRNFQARNSLRDGVRPGDQVLFYHSSCKDTGIAGSCEVVSSTYADPSQFDPASPYFDGKATPDNPRWYAVDLQLVEAFAKVITTAQLRQHTPLADMVLFRNPRLSVQPVTAAEWQQVCQLAAAQRRHSAGK